MARGGPDYGNKNYEIALSETDNSELIAARQGLIRLDARGRVVLWDNFESGVNGWELLSGGIGSDPHYSTDGRFLLGKYPPIKLIPNAVGGSSVMYKTFMVSGSKRIGMEVALLNHTYRGDISLQLSGNYSDGVKGAGFLRIAAGDFAHTIESPEGNRLIYTPPNISYYVFKWVFYKLVIDLELSEYVRLVIGGKEYDLSGLSLGTGSVGMRGEIMATLYHSANSAINKDYVLLSHVIITSDEP